MIMDLSIIIPALNESQKIGQDIREAVDFLLRHNLQGEILVVDDGSEDETVQTARTLSVPDSVQLDVIENPQHRGKGFAVKTGMMRARGEIVLFLDSGSCIPYEDILAGLDLIRSGQCKIAHGSRYLTESQILHPQSMMRRISSSLFRHILRLYLHVPSHLTDTQCGLKFYNGEIARQLYGMCETEGFIFDIEIICRAGMADIPIQEFPIHWTSDPDSRLSLFRAVFSVVKELKKIKRMLKTSQ